MIFLNREEKDIFNIDKDLVTNFKREGDMYLVEIRHNMTKQLISYKSYYDYQQICNKFFEIITRLLDDLYFEQSEFSNDYAEFVRLCNVFTKSGVDTIPETVYTKVMKSLDKLKYTMQKLKYICDNFCLQEETK